MKNLTESVRVEKCGGIRLSLAVFCAIISFSFSFINILQEAGVTLDKANSLTDHPRAFSQFIAEALGYSFGFPIIHVALASLFKSMRNSNTRRKIFIFWAIVIVISNFYNSPSSLKQAPETEAVDYATALREWTPLAEQGNALAQFNLGEMYKYGQGVPQDAKTALKWFTLAAEQGYADAQNNLGFMYANGNGVPKDSKTAVKWFTLGAEQGHAISQASLGWMYTKREDAPEDYVYAHMWGNLAASNGSQIGKMISDAVVESMTPSQIEKAQDLARECVAKNYKGC